MKALSLWQPWGTAIRLGLKVTETRDYGTPYRGELAIHAAKAWCKPQRAALEEFRAQWPSLQWDGQSRGGEVIALAELVAVERFVGEPDEDGCCPQYAASEADYLTGNYLQGRYGWRLQNVRLVDPPVPVKGHQSLWTLRADEAQAVRARARVPVLPLEDPPLRMPSRELVLAADRPPRDAILSPDEQHRYLLMRWWDPPTSSHEPLVAVGLNPSTADALTDDPTVRVLTGLARELGFAGLLLANLYSYRATDPKQLPRDAQARNGPEADHWLRWCLKRHRTVLCCWGAGALDDGRDQAVYDMIVAAGCVPMSLGTTKRGDPRHPLRNGARRPTPWPDRQTYWLARYPSKWKITGETWDGATPTRPYMAAEGAADVPASAPDTPPAPTDDLILEVALERPVHGEGAPEPPLGVAQAPIQGARAPGAELEPVAGLAVGGLPVAPAAWVVPTAPDHPVKPVLFSQLYFPDGSASQSYTLCRVVWVSQDHRVAEGVPVRGKDRTKRACAVSLLRKVHP